MEEAVVKSSSGRKPIDRSKNLNPYAKIIIVCGMRGIGKTKTNKKDISQFLKNRLELSTLAYDINGDDYEEFKLILPKYVRNITKQQAIRIVPYHPNGTAMGLEEQKELLYYLLTNYRNGLLVLDDFDKYATGARGQQLVGAIISCRHRGTDLMISHQSASKISTTEWENANILRLHRQVDNIDRYKDRIPNYPLVKIANLIVDEVYFSTMALFNKGVFKNNPNNFYALRGYCVYVNMDEHKIYNCSRKQFDMAVRKFLSLNSSIIRECMLVGDEGRKMGKDAAIASLLKKYSQYFGG